MPPLNLPISVFGRPVKPVSIGLALIMITFMVANALDLGAFGPSAWGDILGVVAGGAFLLLMLAFIRNSQRLAELGLLFSATVFIVRGTFLLLTFGWSEEDLYFSFALAIIAAGSYFLERTDPKGSGGKN